MLLLRANPRSLRPSRSSRFFELVARSDPGGRAPDCFLDLRETHFPRNVREIRADSLPASERHMAIAASTRAEEEPLASGAVAPDVSLRGGRVHGSHISSHRIQFRCGQVKRGHTASGNAIVNRAPQIDEFQAPHAPVASQAWTAFGAARVSAMANRTPVTENSGARSGVILSQGGSRHNQQTAQ